MKTPSDNARVVIETIAARYDVPIVLRGSTLQYNANPIALPSKLFGEKAELFGFEGLFLTVPRGDDRDKLLWHVVAEARSEARQPLKSDRQLADSLAERISHNADASKAIAVALMDRFYNRKRVPALLPVHSSLPLSYRHTDGAGKPSGFRMFNGGIAPFMLWKGKNDGVDFELLTRLLSEIARDDELTFLDQYFLQLALEGVEAPIMPPDANELIGRYSRELSAEIGDGTQGAFCQPSLDLFRRDLATVLDTELPRPDKAKWLTLLLSLHIAIRLYRIAVVKGSELDLAVAAATETSPPAKSVGCRCDGTADDSNCLRACPLAGILRFRIGTGGYRPIRDRDGSRVSYIEADQRRMLDMPATLVTRKLASCAWEAVGGGEPARQSDLIALAAALRSDPQLRVAHNAACGAIAVLHHDQWRKGQSTVTELEEVITVGAGSGMHALREDVRKMRRTDLRHQSRDVVNQLMLDENTGPGSLISRNHTRGYFEIDEQLLILIVRLVCRDGQIPYAEFLTGLLSYGLAPQDDTEREKLADALHRLGMLARFSDAGEASFVYYN